MKVQAISNNVVEETPQEIHAEHVELLPNLALAVMTMDCVGIDRQSHSWVCGTADSAYPEIKKRHPLTEPGERHTIMKTRTAGQWRVEEYSG